jgi:hypothetical protein
MHAPMAATITVEQRRALYNRALDQLRGFDDLLDAVDEGDLETAYRLGRRYSDALRLIQEGLGWGETGRSGGGLEGIPPADLAGILGRIEDDATAQYEQERPAQEEFRATWEQTALVRETCRELLPGLNDSGGR